MYPQDYYLDIIERWTIIGNSDLLIERSMVDNRPFDPQIWWEWNYTPGNYGGEYIGPSTLQDIEQLKSFLQSRRDFFGPLASAVPKFELTIPSMLSSLGIFDVLKSMGKKAASPLSKLILTAQGVEFVAGGVVGDNEAFLSVVRGVKDNYPNVPTGYVPPNVSQGPQGTLRVTPSDEQDTLTQHRWNGNAREFETITGEVVFDDSDYVGTKSTPTGGAITTTRAPEGYVHEGYVSKACW